MAFACSKLWDAPRSTSLFQIVERGGKIHEEKKKTREDYLAVSLPRCFPGVQLNSLPTYRRALLSERLEPQLAQARNVA